METEFKGSEFNVKISNAIVDAVGGLDKKSLTDICTCLEYIGKQLKEKESPTGIYAVHLPSGSWFYTKPLELIPIMRNRWFDDIKEPFLPRREVHRMTIAGVEIEILVDKDMPPDTWKIVSQNKGTSK